MPVNRSFILGALALPALVACGSSGVEAIVPPPIDNSPPPPPTVNAVHGRYVGSVTIGQEEYFADALFTATGEARIYFGGAGAYESTVIPDTRPEAASQFVGNLELEQDQATGSGLIIGEGCGISLLTPFCDQAATVLISFPGASAGYADELAGSLTVTTAAGVEVWPLRLGPWNNAYRFGITLAQTAGQYQEKIAEFAADDDTLVIIDKTGQLFFQSASSGCTGNGGVTPDADFGVMRVTLTIESCGGAMAYLNGGFSGLGTFSTSGYWDYDSVLRMWLSKTGAAVPRAAFTLWGVPIYE